MNKLATGFKNWYGSFSELDSKSKLGRIGNGLLNNALYIIIVLFGIYTATQNHTILSLEYWVNLLNTTAAYIPVACGIAGCIVLTGTDLTAGRCVGLTAFFSVILLQANGSRIKVLPDTAVPMWVMIIVAILVVMFVGAIVGGINGWFTAQFQLHPFIVTLSMQFIIYGAIQLLFTSGSLTGMPLSGQSDEYKRLISGPFISFNSGQYALRMYFLYAIIILALTWFIWNKTKFGKNLFAVGSNPAAAEVSGVNVKMVTIIAFVFAGMMYGLSGFIEGVRTGTASMATGLNYECDAIAACVIGGVSFVGGTGKVSGILLGAFLIRFIFVNLVALGVDASWQFIIKGLIILLACALDMRKYLVHK